MNAHIYKLTNTVNGKFYVGSTAYPKNRNKHHFCMLRAGKHANVNLQRDFLEFGEAAFRFEIIDVCPVEMRDEKEREYITSLRAVEEGYNIKSNVAVRFGYNHSPEVRAKMSAAQKGCIPSPETRKKLSEVHKGIRPSAETRAKMSATKKMIGTSLGARAKCAAKLRGRSLSEEHRDKLSIAAHARRASAETRARMSAAMRESCARRKGGHRDPILRSGRN